MKNENNLGRLSIRLLTLGALASSVFMATHALAHNGIAAASTSSFLSALHGFAHPFSGLDHLVGLFLVGLLIAKQTQKQAFTTGMNTLALFVLALVAGRFMSVGQIAVAEFAVLASVVVALGLLAAFGFSAKAAAKVDGKKQAYGARQVVIKLAAFVIPVVVFSHGLAHGAEATSLAYAAGSVMGAVMLTVLSFIAAKVWALKFTPAKWQD